jgi:hypothetical protein
MPVQAARKPRWVLGSFWAFWALIGLIATFAGVWWGILFALAAGAYSVYLFRGGRYGFWFW